MKQTLASADAHLLPCDLEVQFSYVTHDLLLIW